MAIITLCVSDSKASAMTLADLQGDYRVVGVEGFAAWYSAKNSIITFAIENGDLVGRITKKSQSAGLDLNAAVIYNVFVDNGIVHCDLTPHNGFSSSCVMVIYDHGGTLRLVDEGAYKEKKQDYMWELRRL